MFKESEKSTPSQVQLSSDLKLSEMRCELSNDLKLILTWIDEIELLNSNSFCTLIKIIY